MTLFKRRIPRSWMLVLATALLIGFSTGSCSKKNSCPSVQQADLDKKPGKSSSGLFPKDFNSSKKKKKFPFGKPRHLRLDRLPNQLVDMLPTLASEASKLPRLSGYSIFDGCGALSTQMSEQFSPFIFNRGECRHYSCPPSFSRSSDVASSSSSSAAPESVGDETFEILRVEAQNILEWEGYRECLRSTVIS